MHPLSHEPPSCKANFVQPKSMQITENTLFAFVATPRGRTVTTVQQSSDLAPKDMYQVWLHNHFDQC